MSKPAALDPGVAALCDLMMAATKVLKKGNKLMVKTTKEKPKGSRRTTKGD